MSQDQAPQDISSREYDLVIAKKRRFRAAKACYPCRRRKVKCNFGQPCDSCTIRGHPDLCNYTLAPDVIHSLKANNVSNPGSSAASEGEPVATGTANDMSQGLYVNPIAPYNAKVHLGPESLPSLLTMYQSLSSHQQLQGRSSPSIAAFGPSTNPQTIFELLCLQDSGALIPFANLWKPEDGPEIIYKALPEDEHIKSYVQYFQTSLFRILPFTINFVQFEAALSRFLNAKRNNPITALQNPPPDCRLTWFGLLFSILSCSAQLRSDQESELLKAGVFACCSFQCLRLNNFISFPDIHTIQALILLVNFLQNQANAGASWSILGLTIRLAQTLGLHCSPDPDNVAIDQKGEATVKYYIWRSLIWQDTLVSLWYGRPSCITVLEDISIESPPQKSSRQYPFTHSCNHLFITANKISQATSKARFSKRQLSLLEIRDFKKVVDQIVARSAPHLQHAAVCRTRDDSIQHHFFREFVDSVVLCLYRPVMLSYGNAYSKELTDTHLERCRSVLRTYLELLRLDCPIRRSWVFVHITLSCALTLALAANTREDVSDKTFLHEFLVTFSQANIFANVPSYQNALRLLRQSLSASELI
ncbi:uncharacterized protein TrAFT101_008098 [Trichoderma asperellum]|uniref:Zn(2)-C6 fungal-type domain-containing protein n=1 Tax=Trichoderma asperellum (strain ATCC 204424 / CBS 433.97 / NBRC 101777) TaxID=1042311 RepID=A0A2T3Z2Q6_TRIA4|nr:hypothetical protein M441DRAFT_70255 [Trichoderma asperellum CBS 433.97]PTB39101.1 hypothetical protein M441DRAFT_70255 [Trichoderma asperellum CBS 433.97]UKZ93176.1 hypothetical protein TrAFT101_008098 [Trichoderma asperellum]